MLRLRRAFLGPPEDLQRLELDSDPPLRHPTTYDDCFALSADPDLYNIPPRLKSHSITFIARPNPLGILTIVCVRLSEFPYPTLPFHIQAFRGPRQKPTKPGRRVTTNYLVDM
jgi:hypothetical protein